MSCCKKKQVVVEASSTEKFQLAFYSLCENTQVDKEDILEQLDIIWRYATDELHVDELINIFVSDYYSPLHKLSKLGNFNVLSWYIGKIKENLAKKYGVIFQDGETNNLALKVWINRLDEHGFPALFLACMMGSSSKEILWLEQNAAEGNTQESGLSVKMKQNRLECAKILLRNGADPNFVTKKQGMTALHWACFHGDVALVRLLRDPDKVLKEDNQQKSQQVHKPSMRRATTDKQRRARMYKTKKGHAKLAECYPIDIAGLCGNVEIVKVFCEQLEHRILTEIKNDEPYYKDLPEEEEEGLKNIINDKINDGLKIIKLKSSVPIPIPKTIVSKQTASIVKNSTDGESVLEAIQKDVLEQNEDGQYQVILKVFDYKKLNKQQQKDLRVFFWAARFGLRRYIRLMILLLRWSPFMKAFRNANIVSGAIFGKQIKVVREILSRFEFSYKISLSQMKGKINPGQIFKIYGKDDKDNNMLHHAYKMDVPEVRQILRSNNYMIDQVYDVVANRMNKQGHLPSKIRHDIKAEDSKTSSESDSDSDKSEKSLAAFTESFVGKSQAKRTQKEEIKFRRNRLIETLLDQQDLSVRIKNNTRKKKGNKSLLQPSEKQKQKHKLDPYNILETTSLTKKQKIAHYQAPDYCILTQAKTLNLLKLELDQLCVEGGIFYQVYNPVKKVSDIYRTELEELSDIECESTDVVRVVIFIDDDRLDAMAELLKVQTRLKNYDCSLPFKSYAREMFWQFNSRQHHFIVGETLNRELDFKFLMQSNIILDHFQLHLEDRGRIYTSWHEYRKRLMIGMLYKGFELYMQPINYIKDYFGEKMGFYFAWQIHYTGWLIPPMILGVFGTVAMTIQGIEDGLSADELLHSPWSFVFGLLMMIWVTFFNQSWVRRQNFIANMWLVRDFEDGTNQSETFGAEYAIDPDTGLRMKVALKSAYKTQIFVGGTTSLFFVIVVIGFQVILQKINYEIEVLQAENGVEAIGYVIKYLPGAINGALILLFGYIYKKISAKLVRFENHRYVQSAENSLINKIYMFEFVNTYISNFVIIFFNQNFKQLQFNMIGVMVFKQIFLNGGKYLYLICRTDKHVKKLRKLFAGEIEKARGVIRADLQLHKSVEEQLHMVKTEDTTVYRYNEAIIQMGFIACFAVSFPLAPLFSFLTNLLDIKMKMSTMADYGKRNISQGSNGIGNWMQIMNFISFVAIPINLCILLYARQPKVTYGATQDFDGLRHEENTKTVQYLTGKDMDWSKYQILLLAVVIEHCIIGLKAAITVLIPDIPKKVKLSEEKRSKQMNAANIAMTKLKGQHSDLQQEVDRQQFLMSRIKKRLLEMVKEKAKQMDSSAKLQEQLNETTVTPLNRAIMRAVKLQSARIREKAEDNKRRRKAEKELLKEKRRQAAENSIVYLSSDNEDSVDPYGLDLDNMLGVVENPLKKAMSKTFQAKILGGLSSIPIKNNDINRGSANQLEQLLFEEPLEREESVETFDPRDRQKLLMMSVAVNHIDQTASYQQEHEVLESDDDVERTNTNQLIQQEQDVESQVKDESFSMTSSRSQDGCYDF